MRRPRRRNTTPDDADTQDVTLRLCWDAETGYQQLARIPTSTTTMSGKFSVIAMEEIDLAQDPDYEWVL